LDQPARFQLFQSFVDAANEFAAKRVVGLRRRSSCNCIRQRRLTALPAANSFAASTNALKLSSRMNIYRRLLGELAPHRALLAGSLGFSVIMAVMEMVPGALTKLLIDDALGTEGR
jgi:hypothetical protein